MSEILDNNVTCHYRHLTDSFQFYYSNLPRSGSFRMMSLDYHGDMTVQIDRIGTFERITGVQILATGAHPEWSLLLSEWFLDVSLGVLCEELERFQALSPDMDAPIMEKVQGLKSRIRIFNPPPIVSGSAPREIGHLQ